MFLASIIQKCKNGEHLDECFFAKAKANILKILKGKIIILQYQKE